MTTSDDAEYVVDLTSAKPRRPGRSLKLLLIEDSPEDAELLLRELRKAGFSIDAAIVQTEAEITEALQRPCDVVISDYALPQFDGLRAFELVKEHAPNLPFIFASGALGEERAVEAMRAGARDYVLKNNLARLPSVVERELIQAEARRVRRRMERDVATEERRLRNVFEAAPVGLFELDVSSVYDRLAAMPEGERASRLSDPRWLTSAAQDTKLVRLNRAALRMLDAERVDEVVASADSFLGQDTQQVWSSFLRELAESEGDCQLQVQYETLRGRAADALATFEVPTSPEGARSLVVSALDVTERTVLERQMRAVQRMEAVGRLAGGIAHDFNNVLTVIESYTEFLLDGLAGDDPLREDVEVISSAARRAEGLTRQLLAFSRRQISEPKVIDLNTFVADTDKMLRRVIGEDIDLQTHLDPELGMVEVDPSHVDQVLMNLALNARDAMPGGGKLTIETRSVELDEDYVAAKPAHVVPGAYVMIAVSDDGTGIEAENLQHVFEPFFTTKPEGRGTGLGLSTAYGIVKQSGGYIWIYSEVGHGTTVKIYWPRVDEPVTVAKQRESTGPHSAGGGETLLVAEDDESVRRATVRILEGAGYRVLSCANGEEALAVSRTHPGTIDLVLTDVVMPSMSGRAFAEKVVETRPGIPVIYMSAYTDNAIVHHGVLDEHVSFLPKPFTASELLRALRSKLDG